MSIGLLSHRLVFRKKNTLPMDIERRMKSAYRLGQNDGVRLSKYAFRAIEAHSRKLPEELETNFSSYAEDRAITAAYFHGVSERLLRTTRALAREEAKKLAAKTQRLMLQLIISVDSPGLERLQKPILPYWSTAFTGALSVARVAQAARLAGYEIRYPRAVVDVYHDVDLFCSVDGKTHLAVQVKTSRHSRAFVVNANGLRFNHFLHGLKSIARGAERRGSTIIPVWAFCSKQQSGLDCGELRADLRDIKTHLAV